MSEDIPFSLGPCGGGLWFGTDMRSRPLLSERIIDDWPCIQWVTAQIGGIFCHHEPLFGVEFAIRAEDPLSQLGKSYLGSCLPGAQNPDYQTRPEEIEHLRNKLARIGLLIDEARVAHCAEAYFPLTTASAWEYVLMRNFRLVMPQGIPGWEFSTRSERGLDSWDSLRDYLEAAWQDVVGNGDPPDQWLAAAVFTNSD